MPQALPSVCDKMSVILFIPSILYLFIFTSAFLLSLFPHLSRNIVKTSAIHTALFFSNRKRGYIKLSILGVVECHQGTFPRSRSLSLCPFPIPCSFRRFHLLFSRCISSITSFYLRRRFTRIYADLF